MLKSNLKYIMPLLRIARRYFRVSVSGFENIPSGAALLVANHSGGMSGSDIAFAATYYERFGIEPPLPILAHRSYFRYPVVARLAASFGAVNADPVSAHALLAEGKKVLVYPGGDHEAFRPFSKADHIDFHGHRGFVRLALGAGVPIVPIVSTGAHRAVIILAQGRGIARRLKSWGLWPFDNFPVVLCLPWLIAIGPIAALPCIPWPVRIRIRIGLPIAPSELGDECSGYDLVVARMYDERQMTG